MPHRFDLISEPWIPCLTRDGENAEFGIADALCRAHEVKELRDQSPLVTAALHRLLLAVLHCALDGPRSLSQWASIWDAGAFDTGLIGQYLDRWHHRFDLLHPDHPFYQIGGFSIVGQSATDNRASPVSRLCLEYASGNNDTLFDHTFEEDATALSLPAVARALVTNQAYALGGGVGGTSNLFGRHPNLTHASMVGGVAVFLKGGSLFETLTLNLSVLQEAGPVASPPDDRPFWEHDRPHGHGQRQPRGLLELLTWPSRCVRLVAEEAPGCAPVVRWAHYTQGMAIPREPPTRRPEWAYVTNPQTGMIQIGLHQERTLWRDSAAFIAALADPGTSEGRPLAMVQAAQAYLEGLIPRERAFTCFAIGLATEKLKAAKVLLWRLEELPVPPELLNSAELARSLRGGLEAAEQAGSVLVSALRLMIQECQSEDRLTVDESGALRSLNGLRRPSKRSLGRLTIRESGERYFWNELDLPVKGFLLHLTEDIDGALADWAVVLKRAARKAFDIAVENALARSPRELRARVDAERALNLRLGQIRLLRNKGESP